MTTTIPNLTDAKTYVQSLLDAAAGNADAVFNALRTSQRSAREVASYTADQDDQYRMYRLALADLTGNAQYRL